MFGASSEIIKSQFSFSDKKSVCNDDIFMYIMDAILQQPQGSIVIKDKSILKLYYTHRTNNYQNTKIYKK